MTPGKPSCPAPRSRVLELYFMEHRAKVIDIAAFLDRFERADDDLGADEFRVAAFREALTTLLDGEPDRAKRVLEVFSDPSTEPVAAAGIKGAHGAWPGKDARP